VQAAGPGLIHCHDHGARRHGKTRDNDEPTGTSESESDSEWPGSAPAPVNR
jgi:hypothetical protein